MRLEEGFDAVRTLAPQSRYRPPPAPAVGDPHQQVGEGVDVGRGQRARDAWRQPAVYRVGRLWRGDRGGAQYVERGDDLRRMTGAVCSRMGEQRDQVIALAGDRACDELAADAAQQTA